jgi:hypothetical protein
MQQELFGTLQQLWLWQGKIAHERNRSQASKFGFVFVKCR